MFTKMAMQNWRQIILILLLRRRIHRRNKYKKAFWIRQIFAERKQKGEFHFLINDLKLFDHQFFFVQFRMLPSKLEELLAWVGPKIKKSGRKREPISSEDILCVTLRYIVTGHAQITIASVKQVLSVLLGRLPPLFGMF